jgi:hypothetical protein
MLFGALQNIVGRGQRVANFKIADILARNYKKIADF